MGHDARSMMESYVCTNSSKIDDLTKLEADKTSSPAVAVTAESNTTSPGKESVYKESDFDAEEALLHRAEDVVRLPCTVSPGVGNPVFKSENKNERKESGAKFHKFCEVVGPVLPSWSDNKDEELPFPSQEIIPSVPNIVVEHVSVKDAHGHSLTLPFVVPSVSNLIQSSSFRQIRALSDSSVHDLHSSYIPSTNNEFRYLQPNTWRSLSSMDESDRLRGKDSDLQVDLNLRTGSRKCKISRLSAVIEPDQGDVDTFEHVHMNLPTGVPAPQSHFHSYKSQFSQGKSPKTYWMRRHSDSNLNTPPGSGLRPEPYQIRSRSTGDSVPMASVPCETVSSVEDMESLKLSKEGSGAPASPDEKLVGLYEKRLKLKKYLQTRYQTSLRDMRQSSDADDVFSFSPTLVSSREPVNMHINVSSASPSPASSSSFEILESEGRRQFFGHQQQRPRLKGAVKKELSGEKVSCVRSEPMCYSEVPSSVAMEESRSPASACSSEAPVFIFPIASTSDLSINPSYSPRHYSQNLVSPSFIAPTLEIQSAFDPLMSARASPSCSDVSRMMNSPGGGIPTLWEPCDVHGYQNVPSKKAEAPGVLTKFPMFVDSPYDQPNQTGYPNQYQMSDKQAQMLALARPQSYNSLLPYPTISEKSSYQLARFPSMPVLSDTSSSGAVPHWQECGEMSPLFVQSPIVRLPSTSSDKSFEMKPVYSQMQEGGLDRDDSALTRSQFTCPLCSQEFVSYNHLANHMLSHLPAETSSKDSPAESMKVHICRICNRAFSRSDMLTRHTRLHTGLRPYECHLCGQVFSRSDHLHTHLRTHTGEKPYKCTYCPYAAPRRDMVTRHMRIHTRDVPHRGRRSSSVSSDVPIYSDIGDLPTEEVERRMPLLTGIESSRRSGHDFSGSSVDAADIELGLAQRVVSCRTCSLTSCESTEGSDVSHTFPACRAWSSTSTESFESFSSPRTREQLSWSSSTESPDVFSRNRQQFFWSVRPSYGRPEQSGVSPVAVDTLSVEMQTSFERCTVTTPEHNTGEKKRGAKDESEEAKVKME